MTLGSHQKTIEDSQNWITPRHILDALGPFDLDPAGAVPRPWDCARESWTQDGLTKPWHGRVFLNPPFDRRVVGAWVAKLAQHGDGVLLIHARTEATWFEPIWAHAGAILFLADHIHFHYPDGKRCPANSGAPAVLAAFGKRNVEALKQSGLAGILVEQWAPVAQRLAMRAPTPHFAPPPFDMLERGMAGSLLVDPPQHAASWSPKGQGRAPSQQYRTLTLIELMQWPIGTLAADDCWLWLWLSCIHAAKVEALMEAWGFKYSSIGFTWVKLRKGYQPDQRGSFTINDFPFITGHTTRKNCETCYLGRRGRPKRLSARVPELIIAPRREHSRKPDEQYARIEAFGAGPFLELFARQRVPGWMSWGAEVDKFEFNYGGVK